MSDSVPIVVLGPQRDSARAVVQHLERSPPFVVVGRTGDATQAVRMCRDRAPSCALLFADARADVKLLSSLMATAPLPVVVVPRTTALGLDALAAGAAESLSPDARPDAVATSLKLMSKVSVVGRRQDRNAPSTNRKVKAEASASAHGGRPLVLVGTSTGGPVALTALLGALPRSFPVPMVVVQHMPEDYHPTFVEWLGSQVPFEVRAAEPGGQPSTGTVFVAPGGRNLILGAGGFFVTRPKHATGPSPSVDALFESAARLTGFSLCGVVLTGMGADGARGLLAIREVGGFTVVQDKASSIVYGMPHEALKAGASDLALSPLGIAEALKDWAAPFEARGGVAS